MANSTPSRKRFTHSNPTRPNRTARAPYNFVPLPEKVVTVEQQDLPALDRYAPDTFTGWFDCELTTCSPTYVRGMMTRAQHEKYDPKAERKLPKDEQIKLKEERSPFYSTELRQAGEVSTPAIPGSSLRGMLRSLVEVISYSKMKWVNDTPKVTFRAVAAAREDPLAEPYRARIGAFSRNVLAGYLHENDDGTWEIQPAVRPKSKGWSEQGAYLKVKEAKIPSGAISDFYRFDSPDYWPEFFEVSFSASNERGRQGGYVRITQIGDEKDRHPHKGVLVCTGNMIESSNPHKKPQPSPRRNHALVLEPDGNAKPLPIGDVLLREYRESLTPDQLRRKRHECRTKFVRDYRDSLTPFQRDELWTEGGLEDGAPIFYIVEGGEVTWFGHTPNFRIPALNAAGRVATPLDFVPEEIRQSKQPDLAEAIFGWVEEGEKNVKDQRAGRVSFTDARCLPGQQDVWYSDGPLAPSTLGSPKITTFQHYLVQDRSAGHDPDFRRTLAHYDQSSGPTEIRGYKFYWHKGDIKISRATDAESESQLTRIRPLKTGVRFTFRIYFENLRDYELGALAWALALPGASGNAYRHKLGMGKPLGMGAVEIKASLHITDRQKRYAKLFDQDKLYDGEHLDDLPGFAQKFENFMLQERKIAPNKQRLAEVERIRMLLAMLQWREASGEWLEKTRYLSIQHQKFDNEYKERPVLPDPLFVIGERKPAQITTTLQVQDKTGTVVFVERNRPFGEIKPDDEKKDGELIQTPPILFHFSQLARGLRVQKEQRVRFKIRIGPKGPEAYDIRLMG